jgi:hypothetical protein
MPPIQLILAAGILAQIGITLVVLLIDRIYCDAPGRVSHRAERYDSRAAGGGF